MDASVEQEEEEEEEEVSNSEKEEDDDEEEEYYPFLEYASDRRSHHDDEDDEDVTFGFSVAVAVTSPAGVSMRSSAVPFGSFLSTGMPISTNTLVMPMIPWPHIFSSTPTHKPVEHLLNA